MRSVLRFAAEPLLRARALSLPELDAEARGLERLRHCAVGALDAFERFLQITTYFAAQRLPAVKWTEFDPFLENRADIQQEMIAELEQHKPPYVVLDSEYDKAWEPNGSSVSTGVHLLDDYISAHYKTVEQYGELTILQRHG